MSVIGVGIDIVEISRFRDAARKWGKDFLEKVFTENEIKYSEQRRFSHQHLAVRFATKEAVFKAFGGGKDSIRRWTDIEILNDRNGKPSVVFHGSAKKLKDKMKVTGVMVSMSHSRDNAVANAVLIGGGEGPKNRRKK